MGSKGKRGQRLLVGAGVFMLVCAIVVFIVTTSQQNNLSAKVAAARKAGFPFEGKSLEVEPPFPNARNAAPYYEKAISQQRALLSRRAAELVIDKVYDGLDEKGRKELDAYIADMQPSFDFMWQGSLADYCYFPKNWDKGAGVMFPEYSYLKQIAKAQAARAYFSAMKGDENRAIEDYAILHTLAGHCSDQPTLIALLVSIAVDGIRSKSIEALFPLALKSESDSKWIRECIEATPEKFDLTGALKTEAFWMWWLTRDGVDLRREIGLKPDDGFRPEIDLVQRSAFVRRAVRSAVLDLYTPALRDYKPTDDERTVLGSLEQRALEIQESDRVAGPILNAFVPVFRGLGESLDRARFRRRSLLAALDVLDHRRKNRAWPSALPAGYVDPFDDQPLRYKVDGDGFRIWSVGSDKSDDGGKTQQEARSSAHDEVFIYPRPQVPMP
jgi:hypothetical protein